MKNYNKFINESLMDKMTGKSKEYVFNKIEHKGPSDKLLFACSKGMLWLVEMLVEDGVDINRGGGYALELACIYGHHDIVIYLVNKGSYINSLCVSSAREHGFYEIADFLIQHEQTNESIRDKMTPKPKEELKHIAKRILVLAGDKIGIKIRKPGSPLNLNIIIKHCDDANVKYTIEENGVIIFGDIEDVCIFVSSYFGMTDTHEIKMMIHRKINSIE